MSGTYAPIFSNDPHKYKTDPHKNKMIHNSISIVCSQKALSNYCRDRMRQGVKIDVHTVQAFILMHIVYSNKVMTVGRHKQYVKRYEVEDLRIELGYERVIRTPVMKQLIDLGLIEIFYHHYRPTQKGRQEIKKIGLYLNRLVTEYHCQPEKIPTKKKE